MDVFSFSGRERKTKKWLPSCSPSFPRCWLQKVSVTTSVCQPETTQRWWTCECASVSSPSQSGAVKNQTLTPKRQQTPAPFFTKTGLTLLKDCCGFTCSVMWRAVWRRTQDSTHHSREVCTCVLCCRERSPALILIYAHVHMTWGTCIIWHVCLSWVAAVKHCVHVRQQRSWAAYGYTDNGFFLTKWIRYNYGLLWQCNDPFGMY